MARNPYRDGGRGKNPLLIAFLVILGIALVVALGLIINYRVTQNRKEQEYIASLQQKAAGGDAEERSLSAEVEAKMAQDSFYQLLADGYDAKLLIVGDGIGTGAGASTEDKQWGNVLKKSIEERYGVGVKVDNISMGDNTTYAGYARTLTLGADADYDLVIVCYGKSDDSKDMGLYYEALIRGIKTKLPTANIMCIKESSERNYPKKMESLQMVADHYGLPVVDTIAAFQERYNDLVTEGEFPNDEGHKIYSETVMSVIDPLVAERRGFDAADVDFLDREAANFTAFQSLPLSQFTREGNAFTYAGPVHGIVLGIDYVLVPGENSCKILVDGQEFQTFANTHEKDYNQRHIMTVNKWQDGEAVNAENEIKVVFSDDESGKAQADGFKGLFMSWPE
ncbi:MAG: SGNH/GDSL hydrolase family protein [Coriobacteriales bacterium]|nr:SGNH/GDSL hydrolase family protein [Coriobacteriales bacterium]